MSIRNVRYTHSLLHPSLNDALKRGLMGFNPAHGARLPKLQQKEMEILDEAQVRQFLIAVQGNRNEAFYHLAIKTGMRQGELLGLKWSDLDWQRGTLRVQRQVQRVTGQGMVFMSPKTRSGRRSIQLGEEMLHTLRRHHEHQQILKAFTGQRWVDQDLIFPSSIGTPQSPSYLLREYKQLLEKAGLRHVRFHDLRHTFASLALNHGIPPLVVSKVMGHSKPSTTMELYGHLVPLMQEAVATLMDELVTPIPVKLGEKPGWNPIWSISSKYQLHVYCT